MEKVTVKTERARILKEMSEIDPGEKRYEILETRLNELKDNRSKIDWNGITQAGIKASAPIILGVIIIKFEKAGGAFVSQASKFLRF